MCLQKLKKLRALEREKDSLWIGLQVLEQARFCYQHQLDQVSQRSVRIGTKEHDAEEKGWSCALRSAMQRVNGSLGSLLNNAYVCSAAPDEKDGSDWYLRWTNATLTRLKLVSPCGFTASGSKKETAGLLQRNSEGFSV
ncbi:suppressor APC domain-containing protein 1 [Silurus asotus]|uniref:Suppressor APC domain-containing protein 1 n=1 Tax=Silurus asotus TaxID=30991 RepID=A0AAD5FI50_SILAS|nr:suppressor APC domain-containing protein 1 [Silurus asotus]